VRQMGNKPRLCKWRVSADSTIINKLINYISKMFENFSRAGYIIIIIFILGATFLSQQPYAREYGKKLYLGIAVQKEIYWAKLSGWAVSNASGVYTKISGGLKGGGEPVKTTVDQNTNQNKNSIFQNILQK